MFGSEILEVAIGLVFVFLVASLLATAVREMIEQILKTRAINLEKGIRLLLDDKEGTGATKALFDHPQIFSLFQGDYLEQTKSWFNARRGRWASSLPAYIPSRNFATALMHTVAGSKDGATLSIENLKAGLAAMPPGRLRQALEVALGEAQGDLERARASLEAWFDSGMDRVSGWYKRESQWILFALGVVLAVALNINALRAADILSTNNNMRLQVVTQAQKYLDDHKPAADGNASAQGQADDTNQAAQPPPTADEVKANREAIDALKQQLKGLSGVVGWQAFQADHARLVGGYKTDMTARQAAWAETLKPCEKKRDKTAIEHCQTGILYRKAFRALWPHYVNLGVIIGWLLTAIAISLGAPFWFDLLNKLMVIRSTVKPNEKSPPEGSKDAKGAGTSSTAPAPAPHAPETPDPANPTPVEPPMVSLRLAFDATSLRRDTLALTQDDEKPISIPVKGNDGSPATGADTPATGLIELLLKVGVATRLQAQATTADGKTVSWKLDAFTPGLSDDGDTRFITLV